MSLRQTLQFFDGQEDFIQNKKNQILSCLMLITLNSFDFEIQNDIRM